MSSGTVSFIRSEGERLLRALYLELFMNLAGRKTKSNLAGAYTTHRELLDPNLFISYKKTENEEESRGAGLITSFLADAFLVGNTSALRDRILTMEAGEEFMASGKKITIRTMKAMILSEPKKDRRDEIESGSSELLNRLNPLYRQSLERLNEYSDALGYCSYGNLIDTVRGIGLSKLKEEAERFLKDTDYVAGDMLNWFFIKKMEYDPKDASFSDVMYLLNSAELRGYFPEIDFAAFPGKVLEYMGLNLPGEINFDIKRRKGKATDTFSIPVNPPFEVDISIYPVEGIQDYESLFRALGCSLCFVFTEPGDDFEFLFLRDETLTETFSRLFVNLLYEPRWLRKYLKINTDRNFINFLSLRRLISARLDAARTLFAVELFGIGNPREMPGMFSQIMGDALKCRINPSCYLTDFLTPPHSQFSFKTLYTEPSLRAFMRESFDEEWWRMVAAGDFLRGIWSEGGRISSGQLCSRIGCGEPDTSMLIRYYEETLG